jgi:hypothetical protein
VDGCSKGPGTVKVIGDKLRVHPNGKTVSVSLTQKL